MKIKIILISILCVLLAVGLVYALDNVLPKGVTKFTDGNVTCYVLKESEYFWTRSAYVTYGGISCIK